MEFDPERFLGDHPEPDPRSTIFGYGRRICECRFFHCFPVLRLFADLTRKGDGSSLNFDPVMILSVHFSSAPLQWPKRLINVTSLLFDGQVRGLISHSHRYGSLAPCR